MAKPGTITIPPEPIGSIPRPTDLIERIAKGDGEDPNLIPLFIRQYLRPAQRISPVSLLRSIHTLRHQKKYGTVKSKCQYIPGEQLDTTDDCGFSPFSDDTSTSPDAAFAKIDARVLRTELTQKVLGVRS